jgi:hypothetical protein
MSTITAWPETPLDEKSGKKSKGRARLRLSLDDLHDIVHAIEVAAEHGIGTFHMPALGNMKVKFDKKTGSHYVNH